MAGLPVRSWRFELSDKELAAEMAKDLMLQIAFKDIRTLSLLFVASSFNMFLRGHDLPMKTPEEASAENQWRFLDNEQAATILASKLFEISQFGALVKLTETQVQSALTKAMQQIKGIRFFEIEQMNDVVNKPKHKMV